MVRVERPAVYACPAPYLAALFLLLGDVVMVGAEHLPVLAVPEELLVTLVRGDVVDDEMRPPLLRLWRSVHAEIAGVQQAALIAADAELIAGLSKEGRSRLLPSCAVSSLRR